MLDALQTQLPGIRRDTVIVVHLLGSHGPAYYQRYPPAFARFTPECRDAQLANCSRAAIGNTYDNTIVYTDHILASIIGTLQRDAAHADAAMLFVSDHGESTGEHGLYLHGAPYALAPDEQTRVPMLLWAAAAFAQRNGLDLACVQTQRRQALSHDNFFHIALGMGDVASAAYRPQLDPLAACRASR